jgi:nucleoside-diphosphate-sugar epimerase
MTNETPKILITAAGGKVGQHVVTQLSQKGVAARLALAKRHGINQKTVPSGRSGWWSPTSQPVRRRPPRRY